MWLAFPNVSLIQNLEDKIIGQIAKLVKIGIRLISTVCSLLCQMLRQKIYICKYIKISNISYAKIFFIASEAGLNKDPMFASIK